MDYIVIPGQLYDTTLFIYIKLNHKQTDQLK